MSGNVRYEECSDPERLAAHRAEHGKGSVEVTGITTEWEPSMRTDASSFRRHIDNNRLRYRLVHPEPDYPIVWVEDCEGEFHLLASVENLRWVRRPGDPRDYGFVVGAQRVTTQPPTKRVQWWEALRDRDFMERPDGKADIVGMKWRPRPHHVPTLLLANGDEVDVRDDGTVEVQA